MASDKKPGLPFAFKKTMFSVVIADQVLSLEEREVICGEPPAEYKRFVGAGQVNEQIKVGALKGKIEARVSFVLPNATTAKEAAEQAPAMFEIARKKFIAQAKDQAMRQVITQPGTPEGIHLLPPQPGSNGPRRRF